MPIAVRVSCIYELQMGDLSTRRKGPPSAKQTVVQAENPQQNQEADTDGTSAFLQIASPNRVVFGGSLPGSRQGVDSLRRDKRHTSWRHGSWPSSCRLRLWSRVGSITTVLTRGCDKGKVNPYPPLLHRTILLSPDGLKDNTRVELLTGCFSRQAQTIQMPKRQGMVGPTG